MTVDIFNVNCLEKMATMADDSVTLTLTDIPYDEVNRRSNGLRELDNKHQADNLDLDLIHLTTELVRLTSGSIYMFCGINQISHINLRMQELGLSTRLCIWQKPNPSPMNGEHLWLSGIEACVFGRKSNVIFNERCKNTVWKYPHDHSKQMIHPTQKPLALFKYLIEASSKKNDLVFDPFMGSGTTGVAAKLTGRRFLGCEIDPVYFKQATKRIGSVQAEDEIFKF